MTAPKLSRRELSRREWFRLRPAPNPSSPGEFGPVSAENVLSPVEHPPNHDGMDLAELPPMREAVLEQAQVRSLIKDIGQLASEIVLMQRSSRGKPDRGGVPSAESLACLRTAESRLLAGDIPRLQIRYYWQDALWIDTLESTAAGFRLVRIQHQ